ncbi:biofilm peroxide resistance protein BsmA [Brenneria rubrifaciens]|uniref:Biofilm peroxide resistance protein BsmA n=1 Tax=Brenneria rubrifaciens TaxID=55213 RepID=A0A4P8QQT7_9GAMM|nr:biofilm peroxide resistance protein BsmA [Brenneria rubrifaciens]QCR09487.1 biofilm peroxide resistance protein BsmA [Brenneria rubrifaciens]
MLRALPAVTFSLSVTACGMLSDAPLPPPTEQAQLIGYAQTTTLKKIGTVSVTVSGGPDDADRAIQRQADEKGARYYTIVMKSEKTTLPGTWFSRAVLYR